LGVAGATVTKAKIPTDAEMANAQALFKYRLDKLLGGLAGKCRGEGEQYHLLKAHLRQQIQLFGRGSEQQLRPPRQDFLGMGMKGEDSTYPLKRISNRLQHLLMAQMQAIEVPDGHSGGSQGLSQIRSDVHCPGS
jgi:hypothetical protein